MLRIVLLTCLLPLAAHAQTTDQPLANGGLMHSLEAAPVVGQPYSAVQLRSNDRRLADGTAITHSAQHAVARDSSGRVRVEQPCGCPPDHEQRVTVFVLDPVAHTLTRWQTGGKGDKVATLFKVAADKPMQPDPVSAMESGRPQPIITSENLGSEIMSGVPVNVTKTTTVVPAGRSHNDQPITKTHELWTSEDMKLVLKEQWVDPRSGTRTVELHNLSRAEPNPSAFQVPRGYEVKDLKETMKELAQKLDQMQATM
jgi:hypothetical protein